MERTFVLRRDICQGFWQNFFPQRKRQSALALLIQLDLTALYQPIVSDEAVEINIPFLKMV
jgi:hypothetical protein